ncbi:MAG: response regulator transcription factor [Clostridiaceae bacterium]
MKKNILIVDDEERIRNLLNAYLKKENFEVFNASNGVEALNIIKKNDIHLIVLDVMMPVMDGWDTLSRLRESYKTPVIMLTARGEEEDKLQGFEFGVDDYETKPFSPKVLVAKIKAMIKRTYPKEESDNSYDGLRIDEKSYEVYINDNNINLSPTEFALLSYFVRNRGIVLSREKLLDNVWGYDFEGDLRAVDTQVKRLREKLGEKAHLIATVRGVGYKFEVKNENKK